MIRSSDLQYHDDRARHTQHLHTQPMPEDLTLLKDDTPQLNRPLRKGHTPSRLERQNH